MTEINKLLKRFKNFHKDTDYSVSDNVKGEKTYTIFSEDLKQSLRDVIHSGAISDEWQIGHSFGKNSVEYVMERDNKFAIYQKALTQDSSDEFSVLNTNRQFDNSSQIWRRREEYVQSVRNIERSQRIVEESVRRNELHEDNRDDLGIGSYVYYSSDKNEEGKRIIRKRSFSDLSQKQSLEEGYGYNLANEIVSDLSKKRGNVFFQPEDGRLDITSPKIISAEVEIDKKDGQDFKDEDSKKEFLTKLEEEVFTQSQLVLPKKQ